MALMASGVCVVTVSGEPRPVLPGSSSARVTVCCGNFSTPGWPVTQAPLPLPHHHIGTVMPWAQFPLTHAFCIRKDASLAEKRFIPSTF